MPRSLYARALLILILPVLAVQLLVSVVFIQRHFDGVTEQMTDAVNIELRFVRDAIGNAQDPAAFAADILAPLELDVVFPESIPKIGDDKRWDDFTGDKVRDHLMAGVEDIQQVSLAERGRVTVWMETERGPLAVSFARKRVSASNPHQLLVIMVVMGALMTAIAYFFLRKQLRPIKRMADAAAEYGKGRIVPYRPSGAVEVRAAGAAFLDMRNRIERQSQSRTTMLSGVSHDLRTPLTRMRLGLSMMDDAEAAPLLEDVDEMQHLVDAFLDFAHADASDTLEAVDPHQVLHDALTDCRRAGIDILDGQSSGPRDAVPLRPLALRRALGNLMNNANRYGSQIMASVHVTDRAVRYVVEDNGPGIPDDLHEDAMRPFVRLDTSRNQNKGSGVGLGLAIVSDIARSHGGMLRLGESHALGGLKAEIVIAR